MIQQERFYRWLKVGRSEGIWFFLPVPLFIYGSIIETFCWVWKPTYTQRHTLELRRVSVNSRLRPSDPPAEYEVYHRKMVKEVFTRLPSQLAKLGR